MMKFLLIVLLIAFVAFMLGAKRSRPPAPRSEAKPPAPPAPQPRNIVSCAQCGLHLPQDEALPGRGGLFCGAAHRTAYEIAHGQHNGTP
jgi:uncharacterized protein